MPNRFYELLFHLQSSDAMEILFLSTQEDRHSWASTITVRRAPWSVIAIVGPVSIWAAIVTAKGIEFYYAGLFTPTWITVGLNILAIYDGQKPIKVKVDDPEDPKGHHHVTGSDGTSSGESTDHKEDRDIEEYGYDGSKREEEGDADDECGRDSKDEILKYTDSALSS
ncbi:hypothetical protein CKAH01_17546 [Colletotrichum kahawae]|uniref:Uncharacterized protein n=1 Tax=Colletotrichum kahawae TaxID=34407 RepID=A0AAE0D4J1_COLKA|nr:hypothetical protein CKAH01_17546 [Colletotrichum kahawae]